MPYKRVDDGEARQKGTGEGEPRAEEGEPQRSLQERDPAAA